MSRIRRTLALHRHGVTLVRLDDRHRFENTIRPALFFLQQGTVHMRYAIASAPVDHEALDLLVLCVHDQDPVVNAEGLARWTYAESYDLEGGVHHIWWMLSPAARTLGAKPAS